ncbi:MAG: phosphotriesterase family protein [Acidobacteriota bacterium]
MIQTISGTIDERNFGRVLVHEHVLVDFIGADQISRDRYDRDEAFRTMLPYLEEIVRQGIGSFVECTPMYLGRDPLFLKRLAEASGLQILINTGLYAAGEKEGRTEPYLPSYAFQLSAQELAGGWLKEWFEGIEGTSIRPGFIKIGVNPGPLRPISQKLVRAAALTSRQTGLAIAAHTARGVPALESLDILEQVGVAPHRYIFVHSQGEQDSALLLEYARRGGWLEFDGISPESARRHLDLILRMLEAGYENQILISQDAGWYRPGEPSGGRIRGFTYLLETFIPMLRQVGIPEATLDHLLIHNPARVFSLRKS